MRAVFLVMAFLTGCVAHAQEIPVNELIGDFDPSKHPGFVTIDAKYTSKQGIRMRKEAYAAFVRMAEAAKKDGVALKIISATRNFAYQKNIWERKWDQPKYMGWSAIDRAQDILKYSAMPGSSRHHWGTDIDLNALNNEWFEAGEGKRVYDWLVTNAPEFGFHQVYTSKSGGRTGYEEEKWHWSYMPLAEHFLDCYNRSLTNQLHGRFKGSETASELKIVERYVNGIHPSTQKK